MRSLIVSLILALSLPAWGDTVTRTSSFEYDPATGLLVKETIEPDQPQMRLDTTYTYDTFGNRTSATVSSPAAGNAAIATRTTSATYDANGQFPVTVTNAVGHTETKTFDPRFGTVASLTGPNGLTTTWQYDGFGRKTRETRADGTLTQWAYDTCDAVCPANGAYRIVTQVFAAGVQSAPVSVAYFDSLNRDLRSATQGFDGTWAYKDTVYDNQGRVDKVSRPYFAGQPVYWISSEYDDLGRLVKVHEPDEPDVAILTVVYNGLVISRTNRKGQTTTETRNSQGQKIRVTDALGQTTTYAYDPFGNLVRTTDPAGNQIVNVYDLRGRKVQTSDPDLGTWAYEYNALGELVKQTDAKGQVTTMTYDKLGRMTRRVEPGLTSDWIYDTAAYGKGKLHQAKTGAGYIRTHAYDDKGRPQSTVSNFGTGNPQLTSSVTYDTAGRVIQQTYPSNLSVKNVYNAWGYLVEVRNAGTEALYWQLGAMDAEGHVIRETTGNGVVTERSYQADNGRLQNIVANTAGGQQIQAHAYVYDTIGNVTVVADAPNNQLEIRGGYDNLNRLTQTEITVDGATTQQNLTYDALGNITSKTGVGTYAYGDPLHRHAVTQAGANTYTYDANGNLTGGAGRALTWTAWNMPASLTQSGKTQNWLYDPEHSRYKLAATGRTTWYLNPSVHQGGHYERTRYYVSGTIEHRHTLYGGGRAIGEVLTFENETGTPPAAQTRYFHSDQQGSITAVTDQNGQVITRFRYDPWGKQTLVSGSNTGISQTRQGHTSHEMLDGGLTHMNGRLYDPVLSRFVSADPHVDNPFDLQSLNRYSYVNNNPLGFTDPSGYFKLFGKKWRWWRDKVVKPVVVIAASVIIGQPMFNSIFAIVGGAVWSATSSFTAGFVAGSVTAGAVTGAVIGGVAGGLYGGWDGALQGAKFGALGGAVMGPLTQLYGSQWNWERVAVQSVGGGVSSELTGGNFRDGFKNAFTANLAMMGWGYARDITDSLKLKSCALQNSVCKYNAWGELLTDGSRNIESPCGQNRTCWGENVLTRSGMGAEGAGLYSASNPTGHFYNENGYFGRFINQVSKVHDLFNSPGYNWESGAWVSRGPVYDSLFQIYSFSGMLPAGLATGYAHVISQNPLLVKAAQ